MHTTATALAMEGIVFQLNDIRQKNSFDNEYYPIIDKIVATIGHLKKEGAIGQEDITSIQHFFGQDFLENTLHGMALLKKYGYAGDFMMIDKIYTGNTPDNLFFQSWDKYFQNHAAPRAVRNRKTYFKTLLHQKLASSNNINLLNVASGPGRDLLELYMEKSNDKMLITTCVEMDKHAIDYAGKLLGDYSDQITFINKNIFKFDSTEKFNVIWSAGLFDYFDNKAFVFILKKFKEWVAPNGEIVIGNFNESHNPTRQYMELFGDWYLHHRTEEELLNLAQEAGFNKSQLSIGREEENVNLFLHITT